MGEKDVQARVYALKDLTTLQMAAGSAVDYMIARAIRAFRENGELLPRLPDDGVQFIRQQLANSLAVIPEIQNGGRWDRSSGRWMPPLQHHYYGLDIGREFEQRMEDRVATCLKNFEDGEHWEWIRSVPTKGWYPLSKLGECPVPSFQTKQGLKVWASIDFALLQNGTVFIIDWKSGGESSWALRDARDQLAVYAIWACRHYGLRPDSIMVEAVWLQSPNCMSLAKIDEEATRAVADRIKSEARREEELLRIMRNAYGKPIQIYADRERFPPTPNVRRCAECRFRELCPEGQQMCSHLLSTHQRTLR